MKLITLNVQEYYLKALDMLVKQKLYPNRAEAIRHAIRDLIISHGSHDHTLSKRDLIKLRQRGEPKRVRSL